MHKLRLAKGAFVLVAACAGIVATQPGYADDAQTQALKDQMHSMQQQMEQLQKQIDALSSKAAAKPAAPPAAAAGPAKPAESTEPKFDKWLKGFYGTLDVSIDDVTKGIAGKVAYPYSLVDPANPNSGYVRGTTPKGGPVGSLGWIGELATNKSALGYRGSHKIDGSSVDFIYQIEAGIAITYAPGISTSYTAQKNTTTTGIGYGDSYVGLSNNSWGKFKIGTTYSPYKKSTDRMNPFSGLLGDYSVVMGNTGGDNRVEFGTRLDHSIWYESPKFGGMVSFDALISPGANRTYNNVIQSSGSPDCSGGNMPGSGNLPLNCDDGGFGTGYSADIKFETGGFYATAAWELHHHVNRNSDGIGSNSPIYGYYFNTGLANNAAAPMLDWGAYGTYLAEYGPAFIAANGFSAPYLTDIGDEWAVKGGVQYAFGFGLTVSGIYEWMKRDLPPNLEFQNERTRMGTWFAASYTPWPKDNFSIGWAHAGATPGDPGGEHNYNPTSTQNQANMYTIAWKHYFDKSFYAYLDAADTVNDGNAHYDLGAGRLTTDCHDGTNTVFNDYSSAGPTTWGGCHIIGVSLGMDYKF